MESINTLITKVVCMKTQKLFTIITITNYIFLTYFLQREHVFRYSSFLDVFQDITEIHVISGTNYYTIHSNTHEFILVRNQLYVGSGDNTFQDIMILVGK